VNIVFEIIVGSLLFTYV